VDEVIKKLKCIRSQYSREKQKVRLRKARYGVDDACASRWAYFDRLSFLDNFVILKGNSVAMVRFRSLFVVVVCLFSASIPGGLDLLFVTK